MPRVEVTIAYTDGELMEQFTIYHPLVSDEVELATAIRNYLEGKFEVEEELI